MRHRIAVAAIAASAFIVGACADQDGDPLATAPEQRAGVHYFTSGTATVVDPRTGKRIAVKPAESAVGVSANIASGSGATPGVIVSRGSPGIGTFGGTGTVAFVDESNHHHMLAYLYRGSGGPPVAMQHYVDGDLVSATAYSWQQTSAGWVRTRSYLQAVRNGRLVGTYTTSTTVSGGPTGGGGGGGKGGGPAIPVRFEHPPAVSPFHRAVGAIAYGLAFSLAPQDASAQGKLFITTCLPDFLKYSAAAALVVGLAATIVEAPVFTPVLLMQMTGALSTLAYSEDLILDCVVNHMQFIGMRGIGSSGGRSQPPPAECLQGSYAPQCSTPFTL